MPGRGDNLRHQSALHHLRESDGDQRHSAGGFRRGLSRRFGLPAGQGGRDGAGEPGGAARAGEEMRERAI